MTNSPITAAISSQLRTLHAAERAQVSELRILIDECTVPAIRVTLEQHLEATKRHAELLEARLDELNVGTSLRAVAQAIAPVMVKGIVDRVRRDDPYLVVRDAVATEAQEIISYRLLELEAIRAGDEATAVLAGEICADEVAARDALMAHAHQVAHQTVELVRGDPHPERTAMVQQLRAVHALERTAAALLTSVRSTVHDEFVRARVVDHLTVTQLHGERIADRLRELDTSPSLRRLVQGSLTAVVKAPIDLLRTEHAIKDARDMYVVEHLELVAYAQLAALADLAGDDRTTLIAEAHEAEEAHMVDFLERDLGRFVHETFRPTAVS
jgi:ferritin-like metal-binding protein YciE